MTTKTLPQTHNFLLRIWTNVQVLMTKVVRWGPFVEYQNTRHQDNLQHTHGLVEFCFTFVELLRPYVALNGHLLAAACHVHDYGEAVLKQDTLYNLKNDTQDFREYQGFLKHYTGHPCFDFWHWAYLLQYCRKRPPTFPPDAQIIMLELAASRPMEAIAFDALERLDYLLYALEQRYAAGNRDILAHVIKNQTQKLDTLAGELPGLREVFWTDEFRSRCIELAEGGNLAIPGAEQLDLWKKAA